MTSELILLVDDEPSIMQLARMYFERDGFRIQESVDGESALEAVAKHRPALIVLDVMLPKLDGFEVCRKLRASGDSTPIIMLTARDEDIDKILGLELGADDYLTKPFNPRELIARTKAILRRSDNKKQADSTPIHRGDLTMKSASLRGPLTCVLRNLIFCLLWQISPAESFPASSCFNLPGDLTSTVRPVLWMSTSRISARNWMAPP
jgi:CheY-like chemotaxis protein